MIQLMPQNNLKSQSGNVFILILAGVVLFGALMFTFSRSADKGTGNLTRQQARIFAQEILSYAKTVEGAVDRVRRNGCSENEISFANAIVAGYSNTDAPGDGSCDVFATTGGKIEYTPPQNNTTTGTNNWQFNSTFQVTNVGNTCASASCADLSINLNNITGTVCQGINNLLEVGTATPPTDSDYDFTAFTGSFAAPTDIADEAGSAPLAGRQSGCVYSTADDENIFYHVLLAR